MPSHVRQQIREAAGALLTGLATTGARVYQSRVRPLSEAELPALRIYTDGDETETLSLDRPAVQDRTVRLRVEAVTRAADNLDDTLDAICKEVEAAIGNNPTLSGTARECVYSGTEIDMQANGDRVAGVARMNFAASVQTMSNAPDILL